MHHLIRISLLVLTLFTLSTKLPADTQPDASPKLLLAEKYNESIDPAKYWVSEKLDGMRAYWNGQQLMSRQGNIIYAPTWFTANFPNQPLDGELWIGRGKFEAVISAVRKKIPIDDEWKQVGYYLFELPDADGDFTQRINKLHKIVKAADNPHLHVIKQFRVADRKELLMRLDEVVRQKGEGLMLHLASAPFHGGRSDALLKVKTYEDAEAKVIQHLPGKGKYTGKLGALLVEMPNGIQFRIGTGFSDAERENPPSIGSTVTYKYYGLTKNGIPRFAAFLRVKNTK